MKNLKTPHVVKLFQIIRFETISHLRVSLSVSNEVALHLKQKFFKAQPKSHPWGGQKTEADSHNPHTKIQTDKRAEESSIRHLPSVLDSEIFPSRSKKKVGSAVRFQFPLVSCCAVHVVALMSNPNTVTSANHVTWRRNPYVR